MEITDKEMIDRFGLCYKHMLFGDPIVVFHVMRDDNKRNKYFNTYEEARDNAIEEREYLKQRFVEKIEKYKKSYKSLPFLKKCFFKNPCGRTYEAKLRFMEWDYEQHFKNIGEVVLAEPEIAKTFQIDNFDDGLLNEGDEIYFSIVKFLHFTPGVYKSLVKSVEYIIFPSLGRIFMKLFIEMQDYKDKSKVYSLEVDSKSPKEFHKYKFFKNEADANAFLKEAGVSIN